MEQNSEEYNTVATGLGQILKAAREQKGLTVESVAQAMRLRLSVVRYLEEDRFDFGVPKAFVRGYINNYADLVGVPRDQISPYLEEELSLIEDIQLKGNSYSEEVVTPKFSMKWVSLLITTVMVISVVVWWQGFNAERAEQAPDAATPPVLSDNETVIEPTVTDASSPTASENTVEPEAVSAQTEPGPSFETATVAVNDNVDQPTSSQVATTQSVNVDESALETGLQLISEKELKFKLNKDSWIKVTDQEGNLLVLGVKKAGREFSVSGLPPFDVVVGNAPSVDIWLQESAVAFDGISKQGVAHFKLDADGQQPKVSAIN